MQEYLPSLLVLVVLVHLPGTLSLTTGTQSLTFDDGELTAWTVSSDTETFQTITANSLTTGKITSNIFFITYFRFID